MRSAEEIFGTREVYCINLARRPGRWTAARDAIVAAGFPSVQRVDAVDGTTIDFEDPRLSVRLASIVKNTHKAPLGVKQGVIGCYLSHLAVWQRVVEHGVGRCVVFEDDVRFSPNFTAALAECCARIDLPSVDLFFFGYLRRARLDDRLRLNGRVWGTHSYLLTLSGAQKLIQYALPITEALDEHLGHMLALDDQVVAVAAPKSLVGQKGAASDVNPLVSYVVGHRLARVIEALAVLIAAALIVWAVR